MAAYAQIGTDPVDETEELVSMEDSTEDLIAEDLVAEDYASVEEPYIDGGTIYDLENEEDVPETEMPEEEVLPEEEFLPEEEIDLEEEIYTDELFDDENAAQLEDAEYVLDEIIVKFKDRSDVPGKEKQLRHEIEKLEKIGFVEALDVYVIKAEDFGQDPNGILNRFKNNKYIEYVEPNYKLAYEYIPADPKYNTYQSAALNALNAPEGWDIIKGSSRVAIAVVDSGVASHPDLPPKWGGEYAAVSGQSPANDKVGHGTNVAGVIGAIGDNGIGGVGINWNANIVSVKCDDSGGTISVANAAKGIIWAADNGAKVINLSLGTSSDSITFRNAIEYAYNKGCAIFAASGNAGKNAVDYPARYSNVIGVGSGGATKRASYSNYGDGIDVVGVSSFYTTSASMGYSNISGTSFAAPQVAGLASLIWELAPDLTNDEVYDLIRANASGNGRYINDEIGYGLINIGKTLKEAQSLAGDLPPIEPETDESSTEPGSVPDPLPPETPQEVRNPPVITLAGFEELTLEYGQPYNEMGYEAVDYKGVDLTAAVNVTNPVNITAPGIYSIVYEVADSAGLVARATRTVTVNPEPDEPLSPQSPKITLIGSDPIVLHSTSETPYTEQGARAIDYDGSNISGEVVVSGVVNRAVPGTYKLTYSITGKDNVTATATRDVQILAPTEQRNPRTSYNLSGQAKQGGKITHTGLVSSVAGFMDLTVSQIDKNMTINVQLIDTGTKKAVATDTFTAAGTKQYKIDQSKYELAVTIQKANGNSKYQLNLLMPEPAATVTFTDEEIPLSYAVSPKVAFVGSSPIILHLNGTPYTEQGARALDYDGRDISNKVEIVGEPDTSKAGTYFVTYRVVNDLGLEAESVREVLVLAPNIYGIFEEEEIPLAELPGSANNNYLVVIIIAGILIAAVGILVYRKRRKINH